MSQYSRGQLVFFGLLGLVMAGVVGYLGLKNEPPTALAGLVPVEGVVAEAITERYGLTVFLAGDSREYDIPNKTGHAGTLARALAPGDRVTLWADLAHPGGPMYEADKNVYGVYAVAEGDRMLMSWDQAAAGWSADNRIALWLAAVLLAISIFLLVMARRMPR